MDSRVGEGTVFRVYLPAAEGEPPAASRPEGAARGAGERVLLMEDDTLVADAVVLGLRVFGIAAERAEDGERAVAMYREAMAGARPYDAVILDLTVPGGMGGEEAIRHLRGFDPAVRALVASGYSEAHVMSSFRDHGFRGVIPKPYDLDGLVRAIREVVREG